MSEFTPSSKSAFAAGIVFWAMVWGAFSKLDTIAQLLKVGRWVKRDSVAQWIAMNKGLAFLLTELVNYTIHGISDPLAVMFALGGSLTNFVAIFFVVPARFRRRPEPEDNRVILMKGRSNIA